MTFTVVEDLRGELEHRLDTKLPLDTIIVVEEHPDYPGELVFQPFVPQLDQQVLRAQ